MPDLSLSLSLSLSLQSTVAEKEAELVEYRDKIHKLQSQLSEAAKDSNRATVIRLKKVTKSYMLLIQINSPLTLPRWL